jgi:hypothetical protein
MLASVRNLCELLTHVVIKPVACLENLNLVLGCNFSCFMQLNALCPACLYKDKGYFSPNLVIVELTYLIANESLDLTDVYVLWIPCNIFSTSVRVLVSLLCLSLRFHHNIIKKKKVSL